MAYADFIRNGDGHFAVKRMNECAASGLLDRFDQPVALLKIVITDKIRLNTKAPRCTPHIFSPWLIAVGVFMDLHASAESSFILIYLKRDTPQRGILQIINPAHAVSGQ